MDVDAVDQRPRDAVCGTGRFALPCNGSGRGDRPHNRRDRDSSRPPTGILQGIRRCVSAAQRPPRRFPAVRAVPREHCAGIREVHRETARPDAPATVRRAAMTPPPIRAATRCGVLRAAKRPAAAETGSAARGGLQARDLQNFRLRQRRQQAGQSLRQQGLAGARRTDHQQSMFAGRGDFQGALGGELAAHLARDQEAIWVQRADCPDQDLRTLERLGCAGELMAARAAALHGTALRRARLGRRGLSSECRSHFAQMTQASVASRRRAGWPRAHWRPAKSFRCRSCAPAISAGNSLGVSRSSPPSDNSP